MHCRTHVFATLRRPKHAAQTMHAVTDAHTAPHTTVLPIEAAPTYAPSISTGVPAVFVRFVAPDALVTPRSRVAPDQLSIETLLLLQVSICQFFTYAAELFPALG